MLVSVKKNIARQNHLSFAMSRVCLQDYNIGYAARFDLGPPLGGLALRIFDVLGAVHESTLGILQIFQMALAPKFLRPTGIANLRMYWVLWKSSNHFCGCS